MRISIACGLALVIGSSLSSVASAQALIDNLAEPTRDTTILGTVDPDRIWAAQSFTTPFFHRLDSIDTILGLSTGEPDIVSELRMGDTPDGLVLARFTMPALAAGTLDVVTLIPDASVVLRPGEVYWLVLASAASGSFGWSYAEGNAFTGTGAFGSYHYSFDEGATWASFGGDNPYFMRVNVSSACPADIDDGSATGTPDGGVTIDDLLYYLGLFEAGVVAADFDNGSGAGIPDGGVTIDDLLYFLQRYQDGC